jgi:hypothetical protein
MTWLILISALGLGAGFFALVRWGKLPPYTHKDVLAYIAMFATIGGAMILTLFVSGTTDIFVRQSDKLITDLVASSSVHQSIGTVLINIIDAIAFNLKMAMAGIIVVLLSLGLVISNRTLRGKLLGNEIELSTDANGKPALPVVVQNPDNKPVPVDATPPAPAAPAPSQPLPENIPGVR